MRLRYFLTSILLLFTVTYCVPYDFSRKIVKQGNLLPLAKIKQLKIGMSKQDVAILMGTSLLSPTFNENRWDYAFTWRKSGNRLHIRNLSLHFSHNKLSRIQQGELSQP